MVTIGVDPHKQTHTAAAVNPLGVEVAHRTVPARPVGNGQLLEWARTLDSERVWVIEDVRNVSGSPERFLIDRGETVVRLPPHLMADARRGMRERGKSDPIDGIAIARAALREGVENLPTARLADPEREIRMLALHRERLAAKDLYQKLAALVREVAPQLLTKPGIGVLLAAKFIGEIAGIDRFTSDAQLARLTGWPPIPVSSRRSDRHRLDPGGNRQLNSACYMLAVIRISHDPRTADYLARQRANDKTKREPIRSLKRYLVRRVYTVMRTPNSVPTTVHLT